MKATTITLAEASSPVIRLVLTVPDEHGELVTPRRVIGQCSAVSDQPLTRCC
jgi:hypothetical protein